MASKKLPSFQFYPGDWRKDPALQSVSLAARGLWIEMLCLMFESHRRGYLCHRTGSPITTVQLARMVGSTEEEVNHLTEELLDCGVCSRTVDGIFFSRRMEREEQKRRINQENGQKGGNPNLTRTDERDSGYPNRLTESDNPPVNRSSNRRSNRNTPSSSSSSTSTSIKTDEDTPTPHSGNAGRRRRNGEFDSRGSPADPDLPQQIFDAWNAVPGLDRVLELTEDRRSLIAERLREPTFVQSWAKSLQILAETPFAKGEGERGWLASFDWWLKPGTVVKILEGKYAPAKSRASGKSRASSGQPYVHRQGDHKRLVIEAKRAAGLLPPDTAEGM